MKTEIKMSTECNLLLHEESISVIKSAIAKYEEHLEKSHRIIVDDETKNEIGYERNILSEILDELTPKKLIVVIFDVCEFQLLKTALETYNEIIQKKYGNSPLFHLPPDAVQQMELAPKMLKQMPEIFEVEK